MMRYSFVIDTNKYAGNFERDMCAYCTGHIGECEVGVEYALLFNEEVDDPCMFDEIIERRMDDDGCPRPATMRTTPPKNRYNSVEIFFNDKPSKEMMEVIKERAQKYRKLKIDHHIKIIGFRLISIKVIETVKEIKIN